MNNSPTTVRRRRHELKKTYTRRRRRPQFELHWLARAKRGNETGPRIHWGVGIYDPLSSQYIGVFHTTPEHGDHLADFAGFAAGLNVYRYFYHVSEGAWMRLWERAMHPQPWSLFRNCQHCTSYILAGRAESPTLQIATATAVCVTVLGVLVSRIDSNEPLRINSSLRRRRKQ